MQRRHLLQALTALSATSGTGALRAADSVRPLRVVASFSILADMVREVAGSAATVASLVGPNADAHVFEPTPADAQRLSQANLIVVNGLRFEGWIDRLMRASGSKAPVVVATRGLQPRLVRTSADPHAWQSLVHARQYVQNIAAGLSSAAPAHAALVQARAADYLERIDAVHREAQARFAAIPARQRRVITSHDAFGYLGDAYGITFVSPQGWTTNTEASAGQLGAVIRQVKSAQVRALFVENITDRRLIDRIAQETGAVVGGTLYSDALSAPGTEADTYLRMYAHNVRQIADALSATRP